MKVKIIALPFAGATKYSYREIEKNIHSNFEWINIELPGRGSKLNQELVADFDSVIRGVYEEVKKQILPNTSYIIYGHSMGTLIGYELIKKILDSGTHKPRLLFFTGRGAPSFSMEEKISGLDNNRFWKKVTDIGGLDTKLLNNSDFMDFIEPILRADFQIAESYQYIPIQKPMDIPIFIRVGKQEEYIKDKELVSWQKETNIPIDLEKVEGGHFFIFDQPKLLAKDIMDGYYKITL